MVAIDAVEVVVARGEVGTCKGLIRLGLLVVQRAGEVSRRLVLILLHLKRVCEAFYWMNVEGLEIEGDTR